MEGYEEIWAWGMRAMRLERNEKKKKKTATGHIWRSSNSTKVVYGILARRSSQEDAN